MADEDPTEALIREVAAKHGIAVGRDDPILILQTLNAKLIQESAASHEALLDTFRSELESAAQRWSEDGRVLAERSLAAALAASREAMALSVQDAAAMAAEAVRREVQAARAQLVAPLHEARRIAVLNMIAAGMTIVAAAFALWASLGSTAG